MSRWTIALLIAFAVIAFVEFRARRAETRGGAAGLESAGSATPTGAPVDYPALSAAVVVRAEGEEAGAERRVLIARAGQRVHRREGASREWLFRGGQEEKARLSGTLVDHERHQLADYDEAELIRNGVAGSFEDVAFLDVSPAELAELETDSEVRTRFGLSFVHYQARPGQQTARGLLEAWWNGEQRVPLQVRRVVAGRVVVQDLEELAFSIDEDLVREPRERFPAYAEGNPTGVTSAAKRGDR